MPRGPVAIHPDGSRVAVASTDVSRADVVEVRTLPSGEVALTLAGHSAEIAALAYSPDGSTLVTASADATLRLWDAMTGRLTALARAPGPVSALAMDAGGTSLLTGTTTGEVTLWSLGAGTLEGEPLLRLPSGVTDVAFDPTRPVAAAASTEAAVTIDVSPAGTAELGSWPAASAAVAVSAGGDLVATVEPDGSTIRVARGSDVDDVTLLDDTLPGEPFTVTGLAFAPDGAAVAISRARVRGGDVDVQSDNRLELQDVYEATVTARNQEFVGVSPYFSGGWPSTRTGNGSPPPSVTSTASPCCSWTP
jgi:hypothetical protein